MEGCFFLLMRLQPLTSVLSVFVFVFAGTNSFAHPISLSSAIVDVQATKIRVEMQIMLEDLVLYHRLQADGRYVFSADDLRKGAGKHEQFLLDHFSILDESGEKLKGTIREKDFEQIDPKGVAQTELMDKFLLYIIEYPLPKAKPSFLTFIQAFGGPKAILPAVMDLHVVQNDLLVERPSQLSYGRPMTMKLDWDQAPSDSITTFRELRAKRDSQLKERLGIATYTGLYSFLYITRFEVRHEILIPLLTLEQWLPIPRKSSDFLEVEEQQGLKDPIEQLFQQKSSVSINGEQVSATLTRLNFFSLDINDFALNADPRRVSLHQARVGIILTYPSPKSPKEVSVDWKMFSDHARFMRSILLVERQAPAEHIFNPKVESFQWTGEIETPQVKPLAKNDPKWNSANRQEAIAHILTNIYRAFDFREDGDVYDVLATSMKGDILREVYLKTKRSLLMAEQGGALSHVTDVTIRSVAPVGKSNTEYDVLWQVSGTTEHWGHIHRRVSEFEARLQLVLHENHWKLEKYQLRNEKLISFETSIRGND